MCQMYFDRANEEFLANNMDSFFWPMWLSECYVQVYTLANAI